MTNPRVEKEIELKELGAKLNTGLTMQEESDILYKIEAVGAEMAIIDATPFYQEVSNTIHKVYA